MPSGEEIQRALRGFVDTWRDYSGSEKSEAQTFLNQLFACYGSDRREVGPSSSTSLGRRGSWTCCGPASASSR